MNFEGFPGRACGEHRTVGPHRAWCHDCREWCYPDEPCVRCRTRPDAAALRERIEAAVERTQWPSTGSDQVDRSRAVGISDAVMAVLAEHGLVDREERGDDR